MPRRTSKLGSIYIATYAGGLCRISLGFASSESVMKIVWDMLMRREAPRFVETVAGFFEIRSIKTKKEVKKRKNEKERTEKKRNKNIKIFLKFWRVLHLLLDNWYFPWRRKKMNPGQIGTFAKLFVSAAKRGANPWYFNCWGKLSGSAWNVWTCAKVMKRPFSGGNVRQPPNCFEINL